MNDLNLHLGLDASDRDQAHNLAAVAILGLTAALAGGIAWYAFRGKPQAMPIAVELAAPPLTIVPLDVPMLRPELRDDAVTNPTAASRSITILDGKTGRRETLLVGADDDVPVTGSVTAPR